LQGLSARPMPPSRDRWTRAHGIAWQEAALPPVVHPAMRGRINAIFDKYQSLEPSNQIIHGDMCGNVLFAADLPPLVIDFSPDERPQAYAEAILIADAIAWENAPVALKSALPETPHSQQMLIRAVNFRVIVTALFSPQDVSNFEQAYACFAPLLERLA
ncbi:MAG: hypothetical protein GY803_31915, partial [Chloroflexi bacterium]|nr:hypothetical protein [Chloroflexota bacterium]